MSDLTREKAILHSPPAFPLAAGSKGNGMPTIAVDIPVMYEDEGQDEMGENEYHNFTSDVIRYGVKAHLLGKPQFRVLSNLNVYYHPTDLLAYFSPDAMVIEQVKPLPEFLTSYRIGVDGPAPILTAEVLSPRSAQQQDLSNKPIIYARNQIPEYILVDGKGQFLPERLLLKRLEPNLSWLDLQDADGGVTSQLGFRLIWDEDGLLRVTDAQTGRKYLRPDEAEESLRAAREQIETLQERLRELEREKGE